MIHQYSLHLESAMESTNRKLETKEETASTILPSIVTYLTDGIIIIRPELGSKSGYKG